MPLELHLPLTKADAKELTDVDAKWVSLVKRGANRIPFRITKSEDDMGLDIAGIFTRKSASVPAVVAVLVSKDADVDEMKTRIEKANLSADDPREQEGGATLFVQPNENLEQDDLEVVKLDNDVAVIVKNADLKKFFSDFNFESTSFQEVMAQEGFFPGMSMAQAGLGATISNIMEKAEDKAEAAELIEKAVEDFQKMITGLVGKLPETAFKMDVDYKMDAEGKSGSSSKPKKDDAKKTAKSEADDDGDDGGSDDKGKSKKADGQSDQGDGSDGDDEDDKGKSKKGTYSGKAKGKKSADGGADSDDDPDGDDGDGTQFGQIMQALGGLNSTVEGIGSEVKKQGTRLDEVAETATKALETAKKADDAVSGAVLGGDEGDDPEARRAENGSGGEPPLLDTGRMTKEDQKKLFKDADDEADTRGRLTAPVQ